MKYLISIPCIIIHVSLNFGDVNDISRSQHHSGCCDGGYHGSSGNGGGSHDSSRIIIVRMLVILMRFWMVLSNPIHL